MTNEMIDNMTREELIATVLELQAQRSVPTVKDTTPKNKRPGKADPTRKYKLLSSSLESWGRIPQQQADIATLLTKNMVVGTAYTEKEVFDIIVDGVGEYPSLYGSTQDPTYLFRYYRGLKNDGKHAGFVSRNFIQEVK